MGDRETKNNKPKIKYKSPKIRIKELKKELDQFECEVGSLLETLPYDDERCVLCGETSEDTNELPCQHLICHQCFHTTMKNKTPVQCHICKKTYYDKKMPHSDSTSSFGEY